MKAFYTIATIVGSFALANAQITSNPDGTITCPATPANGAYCAGDSLKTNIIVRCAGTKGQAGNCNDNLAGVPPVGVKTFAPCYQSSPTAGDAACSYNGTVYGPNGTFPVPGGSGGGGGGGSTPPYSNSTTTKSTKTKSQTTTITVCPTCTTTVPGGPTITGGGSGPSTYTAVVTPTEGSGSSGGEAGSTGSGAGASPTLAANNEAAGMSRGTFGVIVGFAAAIVGAVGLI